jgi:hypothetical protein
MGRICFFLIITRADRIDALLACVAKGLCPQDRQRLLAALPWVPSTDRMCKWQGGEGLIRDRFGVANLARIDCEHERSCPIQVEPQDLHKVAVGCVWCSLRAGDRWAVFQATAAASSMIELFERSSSIHSFWSGVCVQAQAAALLFDAEGCEWQLLHPRRTPLPRLDGEGFELEDDCHLNIDACFPQVLDQID